jgi:hypothetical protein
LSDKSQILVKNFQFSSVDLARKTAESRWRPLRTGAIVCQQEGPDAVIAMPEEAVLFEMQGLARVRTRSRLLSLLKRAREY